MLKQSFFGLALLVASPSFALSVLPGETVDGSDYFDAQIADGDADFFGTLLTTVVRDANEKRDGFDGFEIIADLYDVTGRITSRVYRSMTGRTVFAYDLSSVDMSGTGDNGARIFTLSGFAGWDIDIGWNSSDFPIVPIISRSVDGDTIRVEYFSPLDTLEPNLLETILLATTAPGFDLLGTGTVGIEIDTFGTTVRTLTGLPAPSLALIPLPAAGVLLGAAIGAMGLVGRRRRPASCCPED